MSDLPLMGVSARLSSADAANLAEANGLHEMGVRPSLGRYIKAVWARRSFIWNLSASRAYTRNQGSYLGQTWNVLRPVLDASVFIIIFGFVLDATSTGIHNRMAFITIGTFIYSMFSSSVMKGATSIPSNIGLIRSHQFPRAVIPLSTLLTEAVLFLPALVAMLLMSYLTGLFPEMGAVNPTWTWLLIPFAVVLLVIFCAGLGMIFARLGARTPDIANILPFFIGLGRFASAVMFIPDGGTRTGSFQYHLLQNQPVRVYIELFRGVIGAEGNIPLTAHLWVLAALYAVVLFTIGFLFFWGAEETYGRD
jgi:teichoic acid transport system permease protein